MTDSAEVVVEASESICPVDGRDEFNLSEFPLTTLTDRAPRGRKTLEWEDTIHDKGTGQSLGRRVIVTGSDAFGLPTATDADVLFALVQHTRQVNRFTSREVVFSRRELIRLLGWNDEGKNYRRLEGSLNRWVGTTVYFSAWRDKATETWLSETFHILDNVTIVSNDRRKALRSAGRPEAAVSSFCWNKLIFENFRAGYLYPLDGSAYFRLKCPAAKRMFRYLTKHFRLRQQVELTFDLKIFAFEKIGLSRNYSDAGQIKKELRAGLEELESIGFLESEFPEDRYHKQGPGEWTITLRKRKSPIPAIPPDPPCPPLPSSPSRTPLALPASPVPVPPLSNSNLSSGIVPPTSSSKDDPGRVKRIIELARAMADRGVTPATALGIASSHDFEKIQHKLDVFDWFVARKDRRVSKNPGGYLAESIRKDYETPQSFVKELDRDRKRAEAEIAQKQAREQTQRQESDEEAQLQSHLAALTPAERTALEADALAHGSPFLVGQYHKALRDKPESAGLYMKAMLSEAIARRLSK